MIPVTNLINMEKVILLKSKEDFIKCKDTFKHESTLSWKIENWNWFREQTCYYPSEDCLISLSKAKELKLNIEEL